MLGSIVCLILWNIIPLATISLNIYDLIHAHLFHTITFFIDSIVFAYNVAYDTAH